MSSMQAIAMTIAMLSVASTSTAQSSDATPILQKDPSVVAYTTLAKHIDLDIPIDRGKVIAFVDLLIEVQRQDLGLEPRDKIPLREDAHDASL